MTPLMQQYWQIKSEHKDKILLFRMGDFYEMFHEDAEVAAPLLNIALTARNKKMQDETKMCGVPYHSVSGPIAKLLAAGLKVAICEQMEEASQSKGLVRRAVTRILSPGMVYDPQTLDELQANYLTAFDEKIVSFLEPTTGEAFFYTYDKPSELHSLWRLLGPREIVLTSEQRKGWVNIAELNLHVSVFDGARSADERIVAYATSMQGSELKETLRPFEKRQWQRHLLLSPTVVRSLEFFSSQKGEKKGSLFFAIDRTSMSAGARLLKQWMLFPLIDHGEIMSRQEQVKFWVERPEPLKAVRERLRLMGDLERRLGKIASPNCNARDFAALAQSLRVGVDLWPMCSTAFLTSHDLQPVEALLNRIETSLKEELPISVRQGGMIREGVSTDLDEIISLCENSQGRLQDLELRERERTQIPSLKVRYNNVFGYYIEVTKTHVEKVPKDYQRKQTLANAERYTTAELSELEAKVLSAHSRRFDLEWALFQELRREVLSGVQILNIWARLWTELDVLTALAWLALERGYTAPHFSADGHIKLESARHPVVEQAVKTPFIPNSLELKSGECLLLTGPNMAGKSTLMRQIAIINILAQMGSFVPAARATVPLLTQIFTRVGASDSLSEGLSTFMVEMSEAAELLRASDCQSLVLLDEIGRGTSTFDGMSLAQAILEHLLVEKKCLTLFATHYHELTQLGAVFPQIKNSHMGIREKGGEIQFLHTLRPGPANKSYGIQVAELAGLPQSITNRAKALLRGLECGGAGEQMRLGEGQIFTTEKDEHTELLEQIRQAQTQKMTPLEALNIIAQWQRHLS